jgi:Domain of unknown function (DUF4382)
MKRHYVLILILTAGTLLLHGCSGVKNAGPPPTGNATLSVTMSATPLVPPPGATILAFSVDVVGLSLTPSGGGTAVAVPLTSGSGTYAVDLTRLQSDSVLLATAGTIAAGTYSGVTLSLSNPSLTYCTVTTGISGCNVGSITTITAGAATPSATATLTLTSSQQTGTRVNLDLNQVVTVDTTTQVPTLDLTATNALTTVALPNTTSLATGQLDFVEDITGIVSTVSGQNITIQTATKGSLTATANSSTVFSPNCGTADITCVQVNQVASIDTSLGPAGTLTVLEYDPLDGPTSIHDYIEGVVTATPSSPTQFELVTNDLEEAPSGSLISSAVLGAPVLVTLAAGSVFQVDTKGLLVPTQAISFEGATDTSVLFPGQEVAVQVTSYAAASGTTPATATVDVVNLRYTRVAGTVLASAPPTTFTMQSLPPFFALSINPVVQLSNGTPPSSPETNYDGATSASGITAGTTQTFSIRALYFGPFAATPFSAAKVRAN